MNETQVEPVASSSSAVECVPSTSRRNIANDAEARCSVCDLLISIRNPQEHLATCKLQKAHVCQECGKSFNEEVNFTVHNVEKHYHSENEVKSCPLCRKKFSRFCALRGHVLQHEIIDDFSCDNCNLLFEFESQYRLHLRQTHEAKENGMTEALICAKCGDIFSPLELEAHKLKHSYEQIITTKEKQKVRKNEALKIAIATRKHKCDVCEKSFQRPKELERHKVVHTRDRKFTCEKCLKTFSHESGLKSHVKKNHPSTSSKSKRLECKICKMEFKTKFNMLRHAETAHVKSKSSINLQLLAEADLQVKNDLHPTSILPNASSSPPIRALPGQDRWISLPGDVRTTALEPVDPSAVIIEAEEEQGLDVDLDMVTGCDLAEQLFESRDNNGRNGFLMVPPDSLVCCACLHTFSSLEQLLRHYSSLSRTDHFHNEVEEECPVCASIVVGGVFAVHLANHGIRSESPMRAFRPPQKRNHSCGVCQKSFQKRMDVVRHMRIHDGIKPYKCAACGDQFRVLSTLRRHEKVHRSLDESQSELVSCSICRKSFFSRNSLRVHMISHSAACNFCPLTFTNQEERDVHEAQQHSQLVASAAALSRCGGGFLSAVPGALSTLTRISRPAHRAPLAVSAGSAFAQAALPAPPIKQQSPSSGVASSSASEAAREAPSEPPRFVHVAAVPYEGGLSVELSSRMPSSLSALPPLLPTRQPQQAANSAGTSTNPLSFAVPEQLLESLDSENGVLLTRLEGGRVLAMHPQPTLTAISSSGRMHVRATRSSLDASNQLARLRASAFAPLHVERDEAGVCSVCDVPFNTAEEAAAHHASEDHETAQLLAPLARRDARTAASFVLPQKNSDDMVCKLCSGHFAGVRQLVQHIQREHEGDHPKSLSIHPLHHTAPLR